MLRRGNLTIFLFMDYLINFDGLGTNPVIVFEWSPLSYWEPLHYHLCYEIGLALWGRGTFNVENILYEVNPGDIFILAPYRGHIARSDPERGCRYVFAYFRPDFVLSTMEDDQLIMDVFHPSLTPKIDSMEPEAQAIASLVKDALCLFNAEQPGRRLVVRARLLEAIFLAHQYYFRKGKTVPGVANSRRYYMRMLSAVNYIRNNLKADLDCEAIAEKFNMSPSRFAHLFSRALGMPLARYVRKARLERARELLIYSDMSIKQIAYEVGCASPTVLARQFKKMYGQTPSRYIISQRGENARQRKAE